MLGHPRKCLGMSLRVTNKGESRFGISNDRGKVAEEWKHHWLNCLKRRRDLSVEVSVLLGWDPKVLLARRQAQPSLVCGSCAVIRCQFMTDRSHIAERLPVPLVSTSFTTATTVRLPSPVCTPQTGSAIVDGVGCTSHGGRKFYRDF